MRDIIAHDKEHTTETFNWFVTKVKNDAQRLFEDPTYYDNQKETFQFGY